VLRDRRVVKTNLVGSVLDDHIGLVILEISQRQKNNISLVDPDLIVRHPSSDQLSRRCLVEPEHDPRETHLLPHLSSDMRQSLFTVKALSFYTSVSEHLQYLSVLCHAGSQGNSRFHRIALYVVSVSY